MKTILQQGRPTKHGNWMVIPAEFIPSYRRLEYQVRDLVLREEAEQANVERFNTGIERAAQLAEGYSVATKDLAARIRALKLPQDHKPVDDLLLVEISKVAP